MNSMMFCSQEFTYLTNSHRLPVATMRFPRNLFRRRNRDQPSVLDYDTTEALASALTCSRTGCLINAPNDDVTITSEPTSLSSKGERTTPRNNLPLVVDWKLPVFDSNTTHEQTIEHELQRLIALQSYNLLEIEREEVFDRITKLATEVFEASVAMINLVDLGRQWFLSGQGTGDMESIPRNESICAHVVQGKANRPLVVPDLSEDFRFKSFSFVAGPPHMRFYAGAPLLSPEGFKLGALCVLDGTPRLQGLMDFEEEILIDLADMAMKIMVERREKMREYVKEINLDEEYDANSCFGNLENLLGPQVTKMPKLLQSLNRMVDSLPRQVPITIEIDPNVPYELECSDVILLRATLSLLSHSAGRTENGSIHFRIQVKNKRIVFGCEDTGPPVSNKPKEAQKYFDSAPKSSGISVMVALIRSMGGEYGIDSVVSSNAHPSTMFWFSLKKIGPTSTMKVSGYTSDSHVLRTMHAPNQATDTTEKITSDMENLMSSAGSSMTPLESVCRACCTSGKK